VVRATYAAFGLPEHVAVQASLTHDLVDDSAD
jgi:hypothetical protein